MTTYVVSAGQTSSGITLSAGDVMSVLSGGSAIRTTVIRDRKRISESRCSTCSS